MHKKISVFFVFLFVGFFVLPAAASAHENHVYRIGGADYQFTIGSLGEPVVIDDKTGVDFRLRRIDTDTPVEGADQTIHVEVSAGNVKKTMTLSPVFGEPGAYKTTFYPTVQTTLTYRFFGSLNNTPIDLSFTCNPAGHPQAAEDTRVVEISDGVTRMLKRGAFGCPVAKADLGFPEPSVALIDTARTDNVSAIENSIATAHSYSLIALLVGAIGLCMGLVGLMRRRV